MADKPQGPEQDDWESEGGALAPEPEEKTPKGLKNPVPKRNGFLDAPRKIVEPVRKKP